MRHGSLFSGIGGFDLASQWMGWKNVFHCEWNEFGQKVLNYYWPNAKSYTDITKTDFSIHRGSIDILTGGFPCQPYSMAGKRKGKEDNRHLWPEMLRAIKEIQPSWVVGENVHGLINWSGGLVFHEVQTDLEAAGYEVWSYVLPACAVNAPHRRDRVWFVAHRNTEQRERKEGRFQSEFVDGSEAFTTDPNYTGNATQRSGTDRNGHEGQRQQISQRGKISEYLYESRAAVRFENFPTQSPLCGRNDGVSSELVGITVPKHRTESIKAYGNAIVPQVAYQIFKTINEYIKQLK